TDRLVCHRDAVTAPKRSALTPRIKSRHQPCRFLTTMRLNLTSRASPRHFPHIRQGSILPALVQTDRRLDATKTQIAKTLLQLPKPPTVRELRKFFYTSQ
ncbi:MAG: hypothetical protein AAB571_05245, partial [Chloroflexota bacterium]